MPILRPYQVEAVKELLDKKKVIIADDMSMGKTAEAIVGKTAIERRLGYDSPTLVVCPASVMEHWEGEIKRWYKKGDSTRVAKLRTASYNQDVESASESDFVIVSYPTLSKFGHKETQIERLRRLGFGYGVIDEGHNAKNPKSIRSLAVKNLFDSMDYLAILSGTPVPNTVVDIYMLLSLLDPDKFPISSENSRAILAGFYREFRQDPECVRKILNDRMLRRTVDDYLHLKMPRASIGDLEVELQDEHADTYQELYDNDFIQPTHKLMQLIKASVDPNLVNPAYLSYKLASRLGSMKSSVYERLDDLVEGAVDSSGKVLIFSNLKVGVTRKLQDRFRKYGALVIEGGDSQKENGDLAVREELRRRFQRDPDYKVLIATTVMDEGVDLSAATDVVHLTLPYTPAAFEQRNRRAQRIGEVDKNEVRVHVVKPKLANLLPVITEGVASLLEDKRRIIKYIIENPFAITRDDLDEVKNGGVHKSRNIRPLLASPIKSVINHFGQLKGSGFNKILAHYRKIPREAEIIARLYTEAWEGFYGGNTANLYATVINLLEENEDLGRKLDIASGPFSLSRRIKMPVTNLDLNVEMINAGRLLEQKERIVPGNVALQGAFHQLPFADKSFDLAVCSLALHMSGVKTKYRGKTVNERELALREVNRVLREGGHYILTLPHSVINESDLPAFNYGLEQLGFEVLPFSGFYKGPEDSRFKVFIAGLRKVSEPLVDSLDDKSLVWKMDERISSPRRNPNLRKKQPVKDLREIEREVVSEFYSARSGRSLESSVRELK